MSVRTIDLDDRERWTVIAALHYWRNDLDDPPAELLEKATLGGTVPALSGDEVLELMGRFGTAEQKQEVLPVELFGRIKKSSKYYYQGLDEKRKPLLFPIERLYTKAQQPDGYQVRLNNNRYRFEDIDLFAKVGEEVIKL